MEKPNLTKISLQELIDSKRIIWEDRGHIKDYIPTFIEEQLSEGGSKLEFYVNEKSQLSFPLQLALINDNTFVPNIPIYQIDFQDEVYFNTGSPLFNFGTNRHMVCNVKRVWMTWFGESESGWGDIDEMAVSKSCTKRTWDKKSSKVNSSIEYEVIKYKLQ